MSFNDSFHTHPKFSLIWSADVTFDETLNKSLYLVTLQLSCATKHTVLAVCSNFDVCCVFFLGIPILISSYYVKAPLNSDYFTTTLLASATNMHNLFHKHWPCYYYLFCIMYTLVVIKISIYNYT